MEGLGISTTIDQGQRNTSLFNEQAEEIFDQVMKVKRNKIDKAFNGKLLNKRLAYYCSRESKNMKNKN